MAARACACQAESGPAVGQSERREGRLSLRAQPLRADALQGSSRLKIDLSSVDFDGPVEMSFKKTAVRQTMQNHPEIRLLVTGSCHIVLGRGPPGSADARHVCSQSADDGATRRRRVLNRGRDGTRCAPVRSASVTRPFNCMQKVTRFARGAGRIWPSPEQGRRHRAGGRNVCPNCLFLLAICMMQMGRGEELWLTTNKRAARATSPPARGAERLNSMPRLAVKATRTTINLPARGLADRKVALRVRVRPVRDPNPAARRAGRPSNMPRRAVKATRMTISLLVRGRARRVRSRAVVRRKAPDQLAG